MGLFDFVKNAGAKIFGREDKAPAPRRRSEMSRRPSSRR